MNRFPEKPQLPSAAVTAVAIGKRYLWDFAPRLEHLGVEVFAVSGPECLDYRLRDHADLLLLHTGGDRFLAAEGIELHNNFTNINYVNLSRNDAALNICLLGTIWLGCPAYAAWRPEKLKCIAVRQRYARCSTCIVDEHSIITADHGVATAAKANEMDVLEITPGHILLEGFNYGFIGGASFKLAADKLAFTGSLRYHPDEERILDFLKSRSIEPIYLREEPPVDIGSAVLLFEKSH